MCVVLKEFDNYEYEMGAKLYVSQTPTKYWLTITATLFLLLLALCLQMQF